MDFIVDSSHGGGEPLFSGLDVATSQYIMVALVILVLVLVGYLFWQWRKSKTTTTSTFSNYSAAGNFANGGNMPLNTCRSLRSDTGSDSRICDWPAGLGQPKPKELLTGSLEPISWPGPWDPKAMEWQAGTAQQDYEDATVAAQAAESFSNDSPAYLNENELAKILN